MKFSCCVHVWENLFPAHAKASCTHVSACQMLIQKKGFLFCARSYLIEALQAQALPLCHMSWMGSFLGLFINRQTGAVHLG